MPRNTNKINHAESMNGSTCTHLFNRIISDLQTYINNIPTTGQYKTDKILPDGKKEV